MLNNELLKFKKNIFSQSGEDGIIQEIFKRIQKKGKVQLDKKCCEFGAWDGIHLSNTYNLIKNYNYQAVLIEGDKKNLQNFPITFLIKE